MVWILPFYLATCWSRSLAHFVLSVTFNPCECDLLFNVTPYHTSSTRSNHVWSTLRKTVFDDNSLVNKNSTSYCLRHDHFADALNVCHPHPVCACAFTCSIIRLRHLRNHPHRPSGCCYPSNAHTQNTIRAPAASAASAAAAEPFSLIAWHLCARGFYTWNPAERQTANSGL